MNPNRLLLIDDDSDTIMLYKAIAANMGYSEFLDTAMSGSEALQILQDCDEFPKALIVDINMDEMSGFDLVAHFEDRFYDQHPNTAVVVFSSSVRSSDKAKALQFKSVKEFVAKPLSQNKLRALFTDKV